MKIDWYSLLKITSMIATGMFGGLGLLTRYKDERGKITPWGKIALVGILLSSAFSLGLYYLEMEKSRKQSDEAKAKAEATQSALASISHDAKITAGDLKTTLAKQELNLEKADNIQGDMGRQLQMSNSISSNLSVASTAIQKATITTDSLLREAKEGLSYIDYTIKLSVDPSAITDEKGQPIVPRDLLKLREEYISQNRTPDGNFEDIAKALQANYSLTKNKVLKDLHLWSSLYNETTVQMPKGSADRFPGDNFFAEDRVIHFAIFGPLNAGLPIGSAYNQYNVNCLVTYRSVPNRLSGITKYKDINGATWKVALEHKSDVAFPEWIVLDVGQTDWYEFGNLVALVLGTSPFGRGGVTGALEVSSRNFHGVLKIPKGYLE